MSLWAMLPSAVSTVYGIFNKPKKSDFMPTKQINALQNMITERQNVAEGKNLAHAISRPAIRQSAINREKSKRSLATQVDSGRISESDAIQAGIEGDIKRNEQVTDVQERAMAQQIQQNQQSQREIDKARVEISQIKDQARQQYQQANKQWTGDMVSGVTNMAMQGANMISEYDENKELTTAIESVLGEGGTIADALADPDKRQKVLGVLMAQRLGLTIGG